MSEVNALHLFNLLLFQLLLILLSTIFNPFSTRYCCSFHWSQYQPISLLKFFHINSFCVRTNYRDHSSTFPYSDENDPSRWDRIREDRGRGGGSYWRERERKKQTIDSRKEGWGKYGEKVNGERIGWEVRFVIRFEESVVPISSPDYWPQLVSKGGDFSISLCLTLTFSIHSQRAELAIPRFFLCYILQLFNPFFYFFFPIIFF